MTQPLTGRISAHGIGGAKDLPIPLELTIAGAVAALVISFTVLAVAWREPRFAGTSAGRPAPAFLDKLTSSTAWLVCWRAFGMVAFLYVGWAAVAGQDSLTNPFLGVFYVYVWVALIPLSVLFGPVWRAISPVRTIGALVARASGGESGGGSGLYAYPTRLGYWPAALGLYAFVWFELVYPNSTEVGDVRLWCAVYLGVMLIGGALFGEGWYARADPFEVYSTLASKLSIWGRRDGRLVLRSPLANLDTVEVRPGLVAVVAVLFGSTAFDSFKDSAPWVRFVQSTDTSSTLLNNGGLLLFCVGVGLLFAAGTMATGIGDDLRRTSLPDLFAHSIVPIIVGYVVAHYLTYLVGVGQTTLIYLSDPLSRGDNYLGTADWPVSYWLLDRPEALARVKVLAVVIGHVLGVVAAHDRAIRLLPRRHQLRGQLSLLLVMVGFTAGGLYLLFAG